MYYNPGVNDHGLPYDPFKACVVPRAIGWISTTSPKGVHNLAPYSQFTNVTFDPPMVMFSANQTFESSDTSATGTRKDTVNNIEATGVFCWQLCTYALRESVNITAEAIGPEEDEFERAGLEKTWSRGLKTPVPMVAASPVRFECEYVQTVRLPGKGPMGTVDVVFGRVVGVHVDEGVLTGGKIDVRKTNPIARLGYFEYGVINDSFEMIVPGDKRMLIGLEGNAKKNTDDLLEQDKTA
ncbi:flavin reductase fmn-binding protein [Colletotrichum karsti]|uniref:Flavin reductase fmn-binding protein n=1 Tax=Colletotrichum karsti TaxID=1095194 RepID=A0A9P6LHD4_9PEZI|nr:flavin reductase fmn-binding protein [Colletotrichum karsti]KAF9872447.1 flavin reductase fmn-binding protein [Colletotrichum karsti]